MSDRACQCDDPFKTLEDLEARAEDLGPPPFLTFVDPFVPVMCEGRMLLAAPFMLLDDYLARPRWLRWTLYFAFAVTRDLCEAAVQQSKPEAR